MPILPTKVQPGDLITSEFVNMLIDVCADLQQRVGELEASGTTSITTQITDLLPSGTKRVGDTLHIIGQGFDVSQGNIVTIGGLGVAANFGSSKDRELIVTIPNIQGVTDSGKLVTVLVSNTNGTDTKDFTVYPAVATVPQGQLFVMLTQPPSAATIEPGNNYVFVYTVEALCDIQETYILGTSISSGWPTQVVDASGSPLTPPEISLPAVPTSPGATQTVRVQVQIPATANPNDAGVLTLTVTSKRNSKLTGKSGGETITVGSAPPGAPAIPITITNVMVPSGAPASKTTTDGTLQIGAGFGNYGLQFNITLKANTTYDVVLSPPADTAHWTATLPISSQTIGPLGADGNQPLTILLGATTGAQADALTLTVTSQSDASKTSSYTQKVAILTQ